MGLGLAIGVLTAVTGIASGRSASSKAKKLGKAQSRLERATTAEELRRMDLDFKQLEGQAMATIGASGVKKSGSVEAVLKDMQSEFTRQREWTESAGALRADVARRGGNVASDRIKYQAANTAISGVNIAGKSEGWWK